MDHHAKCHKNAPKHRGLPISDRDLLILVTERE
jgi:hypothetical protein